jgi:hypothetical protein
MVSAEFTRQVVEAGKPPNVDLRVLPGLGHLLFHDHLSDVLPPLVDWLHETLEGAPALAGTRAAKRS